MRTLLALTGFEIGYYMRRVSTHVYFLIFFALTALVTAALGGAFKEASVAVGGAGGIVDANAPSVIAGMTGAMGLFGILVVTALLGNAVYRDFQAGIHPLFFTTPVPKWTFLAGRFLGALVVTAWIFASIPLAQFLTALMPFMNEERLGPFRPYAYVHPWLILLLPNLVFTGALFFALAAWTRKMLPNYLGGVGLLVGYLLSGRLLADLENKTLAALLDPFGLRALSVVTQYWTPSEQNTRLMPVLNVFGVNRLLWLAIGVAVFAACAARFRFAHAAPQRRPWWRRSAAEPEGAGLAPGQALVLPATTRTFGPATHWRQFLSVFRRSLATIALNVYFPAIAGAGLLFLVFSADQVGKLYGTPTWPVTYAVLEVLGGTFAIFTLIVMTFFAGELVWQERDLKLSQVTDTLPAPTWTSLMGKMSALFVVVAALQLVVLVAGVLTQAARGYTRFELDLYARVLFGLNLATFLLLAVLTFFVHVVVNHKYVAHLVVVLFYVGSGFLPSLGFEHRLYQYASDTGWTYSDMNRFGPFLRPIGWFQAYWTAAAVFLGILVALLWVRGQETGPRFRLRLALQRVRPLTLAAAGAALAAAIGLGGFIFWNTNVLNEYVTTQDVEEQQADYERTYKKYEGLAQPRIVGVSVDVDLHPKEGRVDFRGSYELRNKNVEPVTEVHVLLSSEADVRRLELSLPATLETEDDVHGYRIWRLAEPMAPGQEARLDFDLSYTPEGFANSGPGTNVVENGSFVNSQLLPSFGYWRAYEISDDDTREEHGLPERERMAAVDDPVARRNTYISRDSDWVTFEAIVSTDEDQVALAPGYLQREWVEDGRRHFHFAMDAPILNFWSVLSARYVVARDAWNDVAIEVYHHPGHEYNVARMIEAVKKSLDYYTVAFGPYQHRQVRIVEFPRYAAFAQSFPNTIPYSESIGFIARLDEDENIDYPFYVTAHEVAHQWFAHQVIGADVQGSTLLSESLSQYAALMVMEKEYGQAHVRRFLRHELDGYLSGRSFERKKELPLALNENQAYVHYDKGSLITYALRDLLGEDVLNGVIRSYLDRVRYQEPPYTNAIELVDAVRAAAPPELHDFVDDSFLKITLYDLRAKEASARELDDGRWEVTVAWEARQYEADEEGAEREVPLRLPIDVGAFAEGPGRKPEDDVALAIEKRTVTTGEGTATFVVDEKPVRAGIDPYNKLVDRHPGDNLVKVEDAPTS